MIEFPFKVVQSQRGTLFRPRAIVKMTGPSRVLMVDCLVDSGADTSMIAWQVGHILGWTVAPSETPYQMGGISGNLPCYLRRIDLEIGAIRFACPVMWALSDDVPNLLGREGVFDCFDRRVQRNSITTEFRDAEIEESSSLLSTNQWP